MRYTSFYVHMMSGKKKKVYCTYYDASGHAFPGHPESPNRIRSLRDWVDSPPFPEIQWLDFQPAKEAEVTLVHDPSLLSDLKEECRQGTHEFEPAPSYVTENSYDAALNAVGATLAVSRKILAMNTGCGFAIIRPPGHHAEQNESMGFCLLNNIAIAAADAIEKGLGKIAILDIDAHHGNGTQAIFWDHDQVGFLSIQEQDIYPGTGKIDAVTHARGRIISVPLPAFSGNSAYFELMSQVVKPWLYEFKPEMLFVSAGFDAHFSDPMTTLTLDTQAYYQITRSLVQIADELCGGRLIYVLEGGYDPVAIKDNIEACLAAMSDRPYHHDHFGKNPDLNIDINELIHQLIHLHHIQET